MHNMKSKPETSKPPVKRFQLCIDAGLHHRVELTAHLLGYPNIADLYAEAAREKLATISRKSKLVRHVLQRAS
jgi:hypothetical protein